jgi:hypothetical protein
MQMPQELDALGVEPLRTATLLAATQAPPNENEKAPPIPEDGGE